jgi:hypothetical protein
MEEDLYKNFEDAKKIISRMRQIALEHPENIRIIEASLNSKVQMEFFETLQTMDSIDISEVDINSLAQELNTGSTKVKRKKEILLTLTLVGEVESYRIIENYLKNPSKSMKTWAFLSYQQARLLLESRLLNKNSTIYIASGLGGKEHRLRYVFVLFSKLDSLSSTQKNIVKGEIEYYMNKNDGVVEKISYHDKYIICTVLVAIYVDVTELVYSISNEINQYGNFLDEKIFFTNERMIKSKDVDQLLIENGE